MWPITEKICNGKLHFWAIHDIHPHFEETPSRLTEIYPNKTLSY